MLRCAAALFRVCCHASAVRIASALACPNCNVARSRTTAMYPETVDFVRSMLSRHESVALASAVRPM
jgi:hypothetical protein